MTFFPIDERIKKEAKEYIEKYSENYEASITDLKKMDEIANKLFSLITHPIKLFNVEIYKQVTDSTLYSLENFYHLYNVGVEIGRDQEAEDYYRTLKDIIELNKHRWSSYKIFFLEKQITNISFETKDKLNEYLENNKYDINNKKDWHCYNVQPFFNEDGYEIRDFITQWDSSRNVMVLIGYLGTK